MREPSASPQVVRFGPFEADLHAGELRRHGLRIKLQEQPFQILAMLLERPGNVVTREELQKKLWPTDTFVDFDHGLGSAINKLRQALGDSAENPRYIETLPKRGFRFIAVVERGRGASGYFIWQRWHTRGAPQGKVMLVVLPFENLSRDPKQEFFSDGMTEEMITQLGGLEPQRLGVIARASAMQYKHSTKSAAQIGGELGVDYLLEGSARRAGGRVRITAQLIQVRDETHVWAESYEGDLRDILKLQREVAAAVAREIQLKLTPQQQARLGSTRPVNPEAHEAYLKGCFFWNKFTVEGLLRSEEYFQQAIDKDREYAPAYAGLATSYALQGNLSVLAPQEAYPKSKAAAARAILLFRGEGTVRSGSCGDPARSRIRSSFAHHQQRRGLRGGICASVRSSPQAAPTDLGDGSQFPSCPLGPFVCIRSQGPVQGGECRGPESGSFGAKKLQLGRGNPNGLRHVWVEGFLEKAARVAVGRAIEAGIHSTLLAGSDLHPTRRKAEGTVLA